MRQVEIGWMHYDDEAEVFKQVRAKRGGGTRKVTVSKDAQKMELTQEGVGLFFPNGRNRLGPSTHSISFETIRSDMVFLESTAEDNFDFSLYPSGSGYEDVLENSNIVFIGDIHLDDTLPLSPPTMPSSDHKRILVVHRGQVLQELIAHFCDEELQEVDFKIKLVLPDGKAEMAYDDGGVVRDCLSELWKEFYEQCTMGNTLRVPFLSHGVGEKQWESVGRIIAFGWARATYLPVKIAPVILEQASSGCIKSDLVENFLQYMPESDRSVFESWRSDFDSVDQEELLEVLDNHSCRRRPTASNGDEILKELAQNTLVQEPAYVIEQWAKVLCTAGHSLQDLPSLYETLQPTARKVVKSLTFPEAINVHQKDIQKYLTTYLRNADMQHLSWFLRFGTGSDPFLGKEIIIDFTQIQGFQRRPVAHTRGCVLELSTHYDSSPDFSSEMKEVLESNVWVMDII
ncbi:hypothetical protein KUCAC02_016460 [Chaenocephalus aceratus]|nr:hypothetical protein KUCAC02_016460 [Chaenocephalus aceratus]